MTEWVKSSGNVFEDLGFDPAEAEVLNRRPGSAPLPLTTVPPSQIREGAQIKFVGPG